MVRRWGWPSMAWAKAFRGLIPPPLRAMAEGTGWEGRLRGTW
jgi:hypothetical protein